MSIPAQVQTALSTLNAAGFEGYLVGGCVRDILLGKSPKDWDITTNATPAQMREVFFEYKLIETGLKHGTVTVRINHFPMEITTYRIDGEYRDNRRPESVTFTGSLAEDLSRRDFTMNAIALAADGKLIDPFCGRIAIEEREIKCVGKPQARFSEDGLRILRALRFAAVLGFKIETETARAIHENKDLLNNISAERVQVELTRLLCGINAAALLREYAEVIAVVIPEILPSIGFNQNNPHHHLDVWEHTLAVVAAAPPLPVLRWAALLHDLGKPACYSVDAKGVGHSYNHAAVSAQLANDILHRLKFDNESRLAIKTLIEIHMDLPEANKRSIKKLLCRHGEEAARRLLIFKRADNLGQAEKYRSRQAQISECEQLLNEIIAQSECFSLRKLAVNGSDLIALGIKERAIGKALNALLECVINGELENKRELLLEKLPHIPLD